MACNKINEALRQIEKEQPGQIWTSVEFFPPKTDAGVNSLYNVIEKLRDLDPVFLDVTWGAGGGTSDLTLELCTQIKQRFGMNPNMHLTCTNMEKQKVKLQQYS